MKAELGAIAARIRSVRGLSLPERIEASIILTKKERTEVSRPSGFRPGAVRALTIIFAFLILLCGLIAYSEWWAYHVNVPHFQRKMSHPA